MCFLVFMKTNKFDTQSFFLSYLPSCVTEVTDLHKYFSCGGYNLTMSLESRIRFDTDLRPYSSRAKHGHKLELH